MAASPFFPPNQNDYHFDTVRQLNRSYSYLSVVTPRKN